MEHDREHDIRLQNLPNEVLCQIIAGLETKNDIRGLLFANKLFQELVYYSWSKLTLKYDNKLNYHSFLALPADRLQYLLELDISNCDKMTNALFQQILAKTPNLQVLRMKNCKRLTRVSFKEFVRKLPSLLALDIRGFDQGEINNFRLGNHLDQITGEALPLREYRGGEAVFQALMERGCLIADNITTLVYTNSIALNEIKRFVNLRRFECHYIDKVRNLDLSGCLPYLERLSVGGPLDSLILGNRPNLTHLSFSAEPGFVGSTLWPDIKNLKSLKIFLGSPDIVFSLKLFPKLEELSINRIDAQELIEHKILKKFESEIPPSVHIIEVIQANPNLTDLRLPGLLVTNGVLGALTKLKHLKKLVVFKPDSVTIGSTTWGKLSALKELTIAPFQPIHNKEVLWFSGIKHIPNLEVLKLNVLATVFSEVPYSYWEVFPRHVKEEFKSLKRLLLGGPGATYFEQALNSSMQVKHLNYIKITRDLLS